MIQKKICMMGAFATGKTSLVARFVKSIFSDKYITTVGVKVDKKVVTTADAELTLILWDLHGEDELQKIRTSYLRGSAGILLIVDTTRKGTLEKAIELQQQAQEALGDVPFVTALNKVDLADEWDMPDALLSPLVNAGWTLLPTSAKTGEGVEELFSVLCRKMNYGRTEP
jgi:hypothetical protein